MSLNLGYDLDEALKREGVQRDVLKKLRDAGIAEMPDSVTDHQLLLFYQACDKDFDDTIRTIVKYYMHKKNATEHFAARDPVSPHIQQCLKNQ